MNTPPTQDEAWLKALPRRVGRMGYAQVRALFDENRQRINTHIAAGCQDCAREAAGYSICVDFHQWKRIEQVYSNRLRYLAHKAEAHS